MTDDLLRGDDQGYSDGENAANLDSRLGQASGTQASGSGGTEVALGQAGETVTVTRPAPGQTVEIQAVAGQTYVLSFPPGEAQVQIQGDNFVLAFDDNGDGTPDSQVVFLDLVTVAEGGEAPTFQIAGVDIGSEVLLGQALALAGEGEVPLDDVAAGPGGIGGGSSAYDDNLGSILDLLVAQGVIPPTILEFGLIELEDRITFVDEAEGEIDLTFRTDLDGGEGGSNSFEGGFEDWQPNQDNCDPIELPMQVIIGFTPADNEELVSFILSGIPSGAVLYVGGTDPSNIVDTSSGSSPLLTPDDLASGIYLLPPEDSGDDIPLSVTATIVDPDSGDTAVISGSATAIIDSVADNPDAKFDGEVADGGEGCYGGSDEGATDSEIESFLSLAPDALDAAANDGDDSNGAEDATDGTAIKTTLELQEGDQVQMTFNFLDAEGSGSGASYQDFAFITINGTVFPIANVGTSNQPTGAVYLGSGLFLTWSQESGYFSLSGAVDAAGTYEFGIGVMNEGDSSVDSGLLIDSLIVTRGDDVVFQDDFTSFDNWEILDGGFAAIVADVHTNEGMPGAPTQGLLIASGPIDAASCGCEVIVSKVTYNEDNAEQEACEPPVQVFSQVGDYGGDYGGDCNDCGDDKAPIFGAGFVANVNDSDGSESLTKITITTTEECWPSDPNGLEMPLSGSDDPTATNFMIGEQVLVHGETVEVAATFADGSTGFATATIDITDGVLTLAFAPALRVQSVDLSGGSDTPFQVRLPQHSDDDFRLELEVTAQEFVIDGELDINNNQATHQAVLNVEVKAVADGASLTGGVEGEGFAEDDETDPANHGEDGGETGLVIPLSSLGAQLIDKDGSEGITELKISLEGADAGAAFVDAAGNPLGATLQVEVAEGVFVTADVSVVGQCLTLTFGEDAAGYDIDVSGLVGVKLPVDDSTDFTVNVKATTSEINPEGEVACETKTTETSFEVHVGGVAGPAAIAFGDYSNIRGCCDPLTEGNTLTLSVFEDGVGTVHGQDGAGPLVVPVFFTAQTQDSDGSEKITGVVLSLDGAPEGSVFTDLSGEPLTEGQEIAGGTVSLVDGQLVIAFPGDGADPIDLAGIGVKLPLHSDDDFSIKIVTTTTEYDDDGEGALVATHETDAFINVKVDAVADPVTVTVDAESASGDEAFAPGESGTVKVTATFADLDGSEAHTVTLKVPAGFTVLDTDGGVQDGDTITWTLSGQADFEANLSIKANDDLTEDETVKWKAKAKAVEQNTNTDPSLGDAECTTGNNTAIDFDKDKVTLDPALPPEVAVRIQGDALCIEEDGQGQFAVKIDALGDDFVKQIQIDNLPTGWGATVTGDDSGSMNYLTGVYTTSGNPASVILTVTLTPPADSDVDVATLMGNDITFTATAEDPESGDTADSAPVVADVNVDAVADTVTVDVTVNDSDSDAGSEFSPGETGSVNVKASFGDAADGSETHTVTVEIPDGFSVGALDNLPSGVTAGVVGGNVVFTLGNGVTSLDYTFQVTAPADVADWQVFNFKANAKAEETRDDAECDVGNNVAEDDDDTMLYGEAVGEPAVGLRVAGQGFVKEDAQTDVTITADATTAGDTLSQVVITAPAGWVLNAVAGGDIASVAGDGTTSLTLTLVPGVTNFSEIIKATPPADTDIDATFTVSATAVDGLDSSVGSNDFPVTVDAILDHALELGADGAVSGNEAAGEQTFGLGLDSSVVNPFVGSNDGGEDADGSETTTVTLTLNVPLPEGATLSSTGGTVTPTGNPLVFTITGDLDAIIDGLQVTLPGGFEGLISGTITTDSREANTPQGTVGGSGLEPHETDNVSTDSVTFAVRIAGGEVDPSAAIGLPQGMAAIKEDSENNVVTFSASADNATDELTSIVIELPNVATGDIDVSAIEALLGAGETVVLSQDGSTAKITITFNDASDRQSFSSSFTLDAPDEDSDVDLTGVKITANAKDITDPAATGSGEATTTIVVDAVLDTAIELGANGATGGSESGAPQIFGLGLNSSFVGPFAGSGNGGADTDGSETTTVTLTLNAALPVGAVLSSTGGTVTPTGDPLVFTITGVNLEQAIDGLQVQVPGGFEGVISGSITTESREANTPANSVPASGQEPDVDDNTRSDSVTFSATVTDGSVNPSASLAVAGAENCIKEDSVDNVIEFSASAGHPTDELTTVVIELPGVASGEVDVTEIETDLTGIGSVLVSEAGGKTTITITFDDADDVQNFSSSFTLDAPAANSDVDLTGVKITANAKDIGSGETGSGGQTIDIHVDAVVDGSEVEQTATASGDENTTIDLNLAIDLGGDGTSVVTNPDLDQPATQGGTDADGSESVTQIVVTLSHGALGWTLPGGIPAPVQDPAGTWTFNTAGASLAQVQSLVDSLEVTPPAGFDGNIGVTVKTTTAEAATEAGLDGESGEECDDDDNVDVDTYNFTVTVNPTVLPPEVDAQLEGNAACIKEDGSVGFDIAVSAQDGTDDVVNTVTFHQFKALMTAGWGVLISDNSAGGSFDGDFNYTADGVDQSVTFTVTLTPPADSDLDVASTLAGLDLAVSATAKDGALVSAPSTPVVIDVNVDAVADGGADIASGGYEVSTNGAVVDLDLTLDPQGGNAANPTGDAYNGGGFDEEGSEAVTSVQVTLSGAPAIASEADANLLYDNAFGGTVNHTGGSLVWTFTGTEVQLQTLIQSIQIDPRDDYDGTVTVQVAVTTTEVATEAGNPIPDGTGANGVHGVECDDADNAATETFTFEVETAIVESLLGKIVINEVGLGVSEEQTDGNFHVGAGLNFIEIRNISNDASGVNGQAIKRLDIEIVGPDGTKVTIDLNTLDGSFGQVGLAAKEYLVLYEDGTWAVYDAGGELKNANSYGSYTPNSPWGFGDTTSDKLAINLIEEVSAGNFIHVDGLLANDADTSNLTHAANDVWDAAGNGSTAATSLLGGFVNNAQFNGLVGDQWKVLTAILAPGQSVLNDLPSLGQAVNDTVDDATKIFARVYSETVPGEVNIPGDTVNGGDPDIDTNQELDWTTSNQSTQGGINQAEDDFNAQDDSDDFDPAQGGATNDAVAGQTVIDVSEGGEADTANEAADNILVGGRGQDFLFGDGGNSLLRGGDHNDMLFGDAGDDRLEGQKGADLLVDVDGEDVLIGGAGDDVLIGGQERLDGTPVAIADTSGDLLVGDNIIEGTVPTFNVVYVVDRSGSMEWAFDGNDPDEPGEQSRLALAKQAFLTLNQQIIDAGFAGVVNIKVVPFSSAGTDSNDLEFNRADDPELAQAINALNAGGNTQYESPLQIAANWLREDIGGGVERHVGSNNFIFFLSDGGDNNGYNPGAGTLGTDLYGIDPSISNLTIEAFGFGEPGASDFSADELGEVETGTTGNSDQVVIVDDVSKIDQIFSGISLTDENFGEDVILGGTGGDMIFGDTLVVDPGFAGTDFEYAQLLFNNVEGPALRLPLDTLGLSDWIEGGAGSDSIMGQAGDDTIAGQEGDDLIYGGDGDDVVRHTLSEETLGVAGDHYDGGRGIDKLVLNLTAAQAADAGIATAVANLQAFIAANSNPASISGNGLLGSFAALGLEVRNFEELAVFVDGVQVGPTADIVLTTDVSGDAYIPEMLLTANDFPFSGIVAVDDKGDGNVSVSRDADFENLAVVEYNSSPSTGTNDFSYQTGLGSADVTVTRVDTSTLTGTGADEILVGDPGSETLQGGGGNDGLWGRGGDDSLNGGAGNDILLGGEDDDTLSGGDGADTFVFAYGGDFEEDHITDFDTAEGDVLDLSSLLSGESANAATLDSYLNFSTVSGNTVIDIEVDSSGGLNDFQIVIEAVSLDAGNTLSDQQVIQNLLNGGNLVVD